MAEYGVDFTQKFRSHRIFLCPIWIPDIHDEVSSLACFHCFPEYSLVVTWSIVTSIITSSAFNISFSIATVWLSVSSGGVNVPFIITWAVAVSPISTTWYVIGPDQRRVPYVDCNLNEKPSIILFSTFSMLNLVTIVLPYLIYTSVTPGDHGFAVRVLMSLQPLLTFCFLRRCWIYLSDSELWYTRRLSRGLERNVTLSSAA